MKVNIVCSHEWRKTPHYIKSGIQIHMYHYLVICRKCGQKEEMPVC